MDNLNQNNEFEFVDGKLVSITNVSTTVILDNTELEGKTKFYTAENDKQDSTFILLAKGEELFCTIDIKKPNYGDLAKLKHISLKNQIKVSIRSNNNYIPLYNFAYNIDDGDYRKLFNDDSIEIIQSNDNYTINLTFEPFDIVEKFNKNYVLGKEDIKIEIADKAGNVYTSFNKIPIYCFPFDLDNLKKLEITFEEQNPSQRYIGDNSIGSVYAIIHNPDNNRENGNIPSADSLPINCYSDSGSIGKLIKQERVYFFYDENGQRVYVENPNEIEVIRNSREDHLYDYINKYEWLRVKIDDIVRTGYVQLYAELMVTDEYTEYIPPEEKAAEDIIKARVRNATLAYATDGEWVTECPNNKKINLEPFVPMYLKESQYFDFVKFTEDFLNTMFFSNEANCKVGVLKKIHDLRNLHDIDELDRVFFNDYAKQFGSVIKINEENLLKLLTIFGDKNKTTYDESDLTKYIVESLRILPYYNRIKGTDEAIKLVMSTYGCTCEIIYKWLSRIDGNDELYENIDETVDTDMYYLSSHFNVDLNVKNYKIEEYIDIIKPVEELIFSIKPVSRVLDAFEYTLSTRKTLEIDFRDSILSVHKINDSEQDYDIYEDDDYTCDVNVYEFGGNTIGIKFLNNDMSNVGLDNFTKFIANNGKMLKLTDGNSRIVISYGDISFVDEYMVLENCEISDSFKEGYIYTIKCKRVKDCQTFINI